MKYFIDSKRGTDFSQRKGSRQATFYKNAAIVILSLLMPIGPVIAAPNDDNPARTDVYFAGIAFTGSKIESANSFPHTNKIINTDNSLALINSAIRSGLESSPPESLNILTGDLASLDGSTSAIALAVSIDRETVVIEQISGHYKILVEISGSALFFDFREKMVVVSRPLTLQRIEISDTPPDATQIEGIVRHLIAASGDDSLIPNFIATVQKTRIPKASTRRIQVAEVSLDESSIAALTSPSRSPEMLQQMLANELTKIIGDRQQISLLPYQKGQAIGGAMSARFSDGKVYMLTIPEPDYAITVKIGPLKNKVIKQTAVASNTLFGAYFNISITEPLSGKHYFHHDLRQGSTRVTPITQDTIDHAASHYENLMVGFDAFATSIGEKRSKWVKTQVNQKPLAKALKQLSELVKACR